MMTLLGRFFPSFARPSSRRDELTELLQESLDDKTSFDSHEGTLLQNFLGLRDITATDVMIPRADIVSVALADGFDDIIQPPACQAQAHHQDRDWHSSSGQEGQFLALPFHLPSDHQYDHSQANAKHRG